MVPLWKKIEAFLCELWSTSIVKPRWNMRQHSRWGSFTAAACDAFKCLSHVSAYWWPLLRHDRSKNVFRGASSFSFQTETDKGRYIVPITVYAQSMRVSTSEKVPLRCFWISRGWAFIHWDQMTSDWWGRSAGGTVTNDMALGLI